MALSLSLLAHVLFGSQLLAFVLPLLNSLAEALDRRAKLRYMTLVLLKELSMLLTEFTSIELASFAPNSYL